MGGAGRHRLGRTRITGAGSNAAHVSTLEDWGDAFRFQQWRESMGNQTTYYAVQPFENAPRGRSKVLQPIVVASSGEAVRRAERVAKERGGAIAFSRTGDPEWGDFGDPLILARFGEVPREFEGVDRLVILPDAAS